MIIRNKILPFKGFKCVNLFGILFIREGVEITDTLLIHENIHSKQMKEMLFVFFYIWYLAEWLIKLLIYDNAYRNISFEREAFENQNNSQYISKRKHFNWFNYL